MLISKEEFIGLDNTIHLGAGGETPALKSHQDAVTQFFADKALGVGARTRFEAKYADCKQKVGELFGVSAETISFLSHSTDGINMVAHALDWQAGDNVVVIDVEFPSDVLPWVRLAERGVETRIVKHDNWYASLDAIAAQIDERTRIVAASQVSYFTGQRLLIPALSKLVRSSNALLLVDATHAAGVVPVAAHYADILVSSCYKWLLATHGVGIVYVNPQRVPNLAPPNLGWHSLETSTDWRTPTSYKLKADGGRYEPGNPSFVGIYILDNALGRILDIGVDTISQHVLHLSGRVWDGLARAEVEMMTPQAATERAGNVCFMSDNIEELLTAAEQRNILLWGSYGGVSRVRISPHLYNSDDDIDNFLEVISSVNLA